VARLFHAFVRRSGGGGTNFSFLNIGVTWGGGGEGGGGATFFTAKISPNGDPKINPLILSKGFFMKNFNNFGNKKKRKGINPKP
jgi:hypothetical protein